MDVFELVFAEHGQPVTVFKIANGEKISTKALENKSDDKFCFQFRAQDDIVIDRGDRIVQNLTGDEWVVVDSQSKVIFGKVVCKIAFVTRPGISSEPSSVVQNIDCKGASIGNLAVGGQTANIWGNATVASHGDEITTLLNEILKTIACDTTITEDSKHDLQIDIRNIENELQKKKPWAEIVMQYIGHIANISSLATLAHKLGEVMANMGLR